MKAFANYFWKTVTVTFVAIGLSVAFSSSASADEVETDIAFEDQVDPAYIEYLLELGSALDAETLTPEEELLREEAERAAREARMVGFEERLAFVIDLYLSHPEFDGGVRSVANGVMYFSTTEAGYEYYSKELKSMIDDGYIVMDATFDMHWPTDNLDLSGVEPIEVEIPVKHPEFGLDQKGLDTLLGLFESEMGAHLEFDGMVQKSRDDLFTLSTTRSGFEFFSIRFKRLVDAGLLVIDTKFEMGEIVEQSGWVGGGNLGATCTGGLPGHLGGIPGLITSKHCLLTSNNGAAPSSYLGNNIMGTVYPSGYSDIAFAMMAAEPSGLVRTSGNRYESMYFLQSPVVGQTACHFGVGSGYSCSTIRATSVSPVTLNGQQIGYIAITQSDVSAPGDSGGPWFSNTPERNALGVHWGEAPFDGAVRSVFSLLQPILSVGVSPVLAASELYE